MSDPCQQENTIGRLTATQEQIGHTLERLLNVLDKVAMQGTRIDTLSDGQDTLFTRVREIELKAESEKTKVGFIMAGISAITASVTAYITKHL